MNELRAAVAKHKATVQGFGSGVTPRLTTAKGEVEALAQGVLDHRRHAAPDGGRDDWASCSRR